MIDISWESIAKVLLAVIAFWILWIIRDVLALFFITIIIVSALTPVVDGWSKNVPRFVAVIVLYLLILVGLSLIGSLLVPPLVREIGDLSAVLPQYLGNLSNYLGGLKNLAGLSSQQFDSISQSISNITTHVYSTTIGIIGSVVGLFTIAVVSFYLLVDPSGMNELIGSFVPKEHQLRTHRILEEITLKMGAWLRGQLLLALIVGVLDAIGLLVIGVPFALTLGVWAGFTEIIPYIGPVLGALPALAIALIASPLKGLFTLVLFALVQQLEGQVLVPKIMGKAVGLSPVVIIFAILVGAQLDGIIGVILAIPVAAAISVIIKELIGGKLYGSHRS
ncbi:AI-2E family transporter [Candidatus Berkelbacteria bacterium]|nr:AI-2E family transporter [Candidatus Berkelbacteria bacterium]